MGKQSKKLGQSSISKNADKVVQSAKSDKTPPGPANKVKSGKVSKPKGQKVETFAKPIKTKSVDLTQLNAALQAQTKQRVKASSNPSKKKKNKKKQSAPTNEVSEGTDEIKAPPIVVLPTAEWNDEEFEKNDSESSDDEGRKPSEGKPSNLEEIKSTVFIGNLGQNIKKQHLVNLLKDYGPIKSVRIRTALGNKLFRHKSRKETESLVAYVVLESPDHAHRALELSGTEFRRRHIRVTMAEKDALCHSEANKRTVFVGNLRYSATEEKLFELFSSCGEVESARTMKNERGCKGVAYVCFKKPEAVGLALELSGTMLDERPIHVERYSIKKREKVQEKKLQEKATAAASVRNKKGTKGLKGVKKDKQASKGPDGKKEKSVKKSAYSGVKVEKKKRWSKSKKAKRPSSQARLAAKIAPKDL